MRKLKPQYEDFCRSYSDGENAFGAAVAAGYSRKSAYVTGSRLLARPEIVARITELRRKLAERESLNAPALLAKLETAYAQAAAQKNTLAIVRVIELQAKIGGLVGPRRARAVEDEEIEREIAALAAEAPPEPERARKPRPVVRPQPAQPTAAAEPVLMPIVGHYEQPPPEFEAATIETPDEEQRREEVRRLETQRLALEAVARSRTRKRLRLST